MADPIRKNHAIRPTGEVLSFMNTDSGKNKYLFPSRNFLRVCETGCWLLLGRLKNIVFGANKMSEHQNDRLEILSCIEPFLDLDLSTLRKKITDDIIVRRYRDELACNISGLQAQEQINFLIDTLSEIKAEMHYLKVAYVDKVRYRDPNFNTVVPEFSKVIHPDVFDVDMRGDITGANWWHAEPSGRWAGPENQSSIQVPALGHGKYRLEISVVSEIDGGIIDGMHTSFNGTVLRLKRNRNELPCELVAEVDVSENYRLPFWSIKFEFGKLKTPRENGLPDDRMLAIMLDHIRFTRIKG
ncbi:MAG: hypothetical protein ACK4UN_08905 [Limisphaerales bacterium]